MLTFYSDPARKQARIDRAKKHVEMDRLVSGFYRDGETDRGCSVGCDAIDICNDTGTSPHGVVSEYDGVPEWLEHLRDVIFEGLYDADRSGWHVALAEAIPVGVDIDIVKHQLADWILSDDGPIPEAVKHPIVSDAILLVRKYHQGRISGDVTMSAARSAMSAATSAAKSAAAESSVNFAVMSAARFAVLSAWSAAESAARSAESSAARSAAGLAWSAAWSAWSAAWSAWSAGPGQSGESAAFRKIADKTILLLKSC